MPASNPQWLNAVVERGAVPATIAVIEGRFRVGLSADELDHCRADGVI